jgi:hypothetical protein
MFLSAEAPGKIASCHQSYESCSAFSILQSLPITHYTRHSVRRKTIIQQHPLHNPLSLQRTPSNQKSTTNPIYTQTSHYPKERHAHPSRLLQNINIPPPLLLLSPSAFPRLRRTQQIINTTSIAHTGARPRRRSRSRSEAWSRQHRRLGPFGVGWEAGG